MQTAAVTALVKALLGEEGFDRVGVARAGPTPRTEYLRRWLDDGRGGNMHYLGKYFEQRTDTSKLVPGARSVVVVALNYYQDSPAKPTGDARGRVARYAWGADYHTLIKDKLWRVIDTLRDRLGVAFDAKPCVDTAPVLEREWAMRSGVGWIGKNTLVLNDKLGSYFFLGEIVTTLDLVEDEPAVDHCGSCTRCLDACPTSAFPAPYEMDAARCLSYHTIELRDAIPNEFHDAMGDWIFGCDICQEVCPFNSRAPQTEEPAFAARRVAAGVPLKELTQWTAEDYRRELKGSAMKRAKLEMLQRNAHIALHNEEHGPRK
jgi:epoxyqueuosine reductase